MKSKHITESKIVIIGGGLSGLAAAYFARRRGLDYIVLEKDAAAGGLCKSHCINGFTFDYTGHLLHYSNALAEKFFSEILTNNLNKRWRNSAVYYSKKFIPFPFQYNLAYLPAREKNECFINFLETYFKNKIDTSDFERWIVSYYGAGIAKYFMRPYNTKLFSGNLKNITIDWFGNFMPRLNLTDMINSVISKTNKFAGYNQFFYYPKKNGINFLIDSIIKKIPNLFCNKPVYLIDIKKKIVETATEKIYYDFLVNTIPLPEFIQLLKPRLKNTDEYINKLEYSSVYNINYGLDTTLKNERHWIYYPEKKYDFYRIGFYHNFSKAMTPAKKQSAYIEISYRNKIKINAAFENKIKKQFFSTGIYSARNSKIITEFPLDIKYAYVIYNKQRNALINTLASYFKKNNIFLAGRYAEWKYASMQDSIVSANNIVNELVN